MLLRTRLCFFFILLKFSKNLIHLDTKHMFEIGVIFDEQ
jgi:hypothetical protein